MTTMRVTLPPNLARHFHEVRRAFLQSAGRDTTPWYRLSPQERAVVESELEIFRQAIRRAEEEQDVLAALDAKPAGDGGPDGDLADDCPCRGCSAVAAVVELLQQMGNREDSAMPFPADQDTAEAAAETTPDARPRGVPLEEDENPRLQDVTRADVAEFFDLASSTVVVLPGRRTAFETMRREFWLSHFSGGV
jgi:hypothetical protein